MRRYFGKRLFTTVLCAAMIFDSSAISVLAEEIDDSRLIVENVEINEDIEINDDIELGIEAYDETLLIDDDNSEEIVLDNDNKDSNDEKDTVISAGDVDSMSEDSPIETWNIGADTATDVQAKLYEISDRKYRLEITGSGTMLDFSSSAPWTDYYICELSIEEGIENIGKCAFRSCSELTNITIPESVK